MLGLGWAKVAVFGEGNVMVKGKRRGMKLREKAAEDEAGTEGKENRGEKDRAVMARREVEEK